jgi:hypothetical protein
MAENLIFKGIAKTDLTPVANRGSQLILSSGLSYCLVRKPPFCKLDRRATNYFVLAFETG